MKFVLTKSKLRKMFVFFYVQVVKHHRVQLEGKVVCTNIKRDCPKPNCAKPILRPNTCCKICRGQGK
jgi:hypothetical protein